MFLFVGKAATLAHAEHQQRHKSEADSSLLIAQMYKCATQRSFHETQMPGPKKITDVFSSLRLSCAANFLHDNYRAYNRQTFAAPACPDKRAYQ